MKIGVIQENFVVGDFVGNAKKIENSILSTEEKEVDFFVSSEMSLWGYPPQDMLFVPELIDESLLVLEGLVKRLNNFSFFVGLATKTNYGKGLYNSFAFCQQGKIEKIFHKCLLPNYDVFDDLRYFEPFSTCDYLEWKGKKIGVGICEDLCYKKEYNQFQNYSVEHLQNWKNLDLILNPASSPYSAGKSALRKKYLRDIAEKFDCPVLFVNQVGGNDNLIFDGNSFLTNQKEVLQELPNFKTETKILDLQTKSIQEPKELELELTEALTLGIKDYFVKTGFQKAVLGLSGGIDSALTLFLAVRALGNKQVTAILMPSPYSSAHSIQDAEELATQLGVKHSTISIDKIMEAFDSSLKDLFENTTKDETEENIQTRIRGTILMAIANKENQLLLTTGNKSEIFAGYCTLYGDMCGSLNPLGDLKKTEVYAICRYFYQKEGIFSKSILEKEPSAELKKNQTDQDKLPPYEELDEVLQQVVLENKRKKELEKNFSKELITKSYPLFQIAEYKRKQAPPILRVSQKSFDTGWRMPLARKW